MRRLFEIIVLMLSAEIGLAGGSSTGVGGGGFQYYRSQAVKMIQSERDSLVEGILLLTDAELEKGAYKVNKTDLQTIIKRMRILPTVNHQPKYNPDGLMDYLVMDYGTDVSTGEKYIEALDPLIQEVSFSLVTNSALSTGYLQIKFLHEALHHFGYTDDNLAESRAKEIYEAIVSAKGNLATENQRAECISNGIDSKINRLFTALSDCRFKPKEVIEVTGKYTQCIMRFDLSKSYECKSDGKGYRDLTLICPGFSVYFTPWDSKSPDPYVKNLEVSPTKAPAIATSPVLPVINTQGDFMTISALSFRNVEIDFKYDGPGTCDAVFHLMASAKGKTYVDYLFFPKDEGKFIK